MNFIIGFAGIGLNINCEKIFIRNNWNFTFCLLSS